MREIYKKISESKTYKAVDIVTFLLALITAAYSMFTLCYRQAFTTTGAWASDIKPYIEEVLGTNTRYNFTYPIMFTTSKLIGYFTSTPELAMVITVTIFNVLAMVIVKMVFEKETGARLLSTASTLSLFFLSMIYGSLFETFGIVHRYIGIYSPNPWHNHTYMSARPFMILTFVLGARTLQTYEKEFEKDFILNRKQLSAYFAYAVSLLLVTMTKPSYTIVHMGAVGLIMIYRLVATKFKNFRQTILMGICYLPTIINLLYQYSGVFTGASAYDGNDNGIGVGFLKVWSYYCDNIPVAMILAAAFPLVVLLFHLKELKTNTQYRLSWIIYLMGLVTWCVFYEKGNRLHHGNFAWGYMCGLFVIFLSSLIIVLKETIQGITEKVSGKFYIALLLQWGILAIHTVKGLSYFYLITVFGADYF